MNENVNNICMICPDKTKGEFSVIITNEPPDLQVVFNGQCFPMGVIS